MTFEKWCQTYQVPKAIGRDTKSYLKWAWEVATEQERAKCLAACVAVQQHWSDGAAESRLPEVNYRMYGAAECVEAIRKLEAE